MSKQVVIWLLRIAPYALYNQQDDYKLPMKTVRPDQISWLTSLNDECESMLLLFTLLFIITLISLFFCIVECGDNELVLGVGVTVGDEAILSLLLLFGEILAGKLKVFVHCAKLRTIFAKCYS